MRSGAAASILLHAGAFGLAFLTLPESVRTKIAPEPVIPIELIDEAVESERTSVPAAGPTPVEKPAETSEPAEPEQEPAPAPTPDAAPKPPEPEKEAAKEPEKKPEKKPEPPKKPADDLDLDSLAALVDKARKDPPAGETADPTVPADKPRAAVGAGDVLSASDIAKMRAAVQRCWDFGDLAGAPEAEKLVVVVEIDLNRDGTLARAPRVANATAIALSGNRYWKVAEQRAVSAVIGCQPYSFFDPARHQEWRAFTLNFDPRQMLGF
jgi:outer membrane biosynthesis protein TonB